MTTTTCSPTQTRNVASDRPVYRVPRANIRETETTYIIEAEMPGVSRDGFDVKIEDRTLTLTGKREAAEGRRLFGHRVDGYERAFHLGETIDEGHVDAAAKNGILTVTLHKVPERVPRKIDVRFN